MTETTDFGLHKIGQIAVAVHNLEECVEFYRDRLGLRFLFRVPNMAFFDCDGVRLMLTIPESKEFDHPASIIYFSVDDIREAYERLSKEGVKFEEEPRVVARMETHDLWMTFLRDPENNIVGIMSEVPQLG